jgi:DMSO/TMAO reductase YedYZ heme-binding membrane subunit
VTYLALGIVAFYLMVIMTVTSYLKRHLNHRFWRILHFLNPVAFVFVVLHGYVNGTDMKNVIIGGIFMASAFILVAIYFSSLGMVILNKWVANNSQETEE